MNRLPKALASADRYLVAATATLSTAAVVAAAPSTGVPAKRAAGAHNLGPSLGMGGCSSAPGGR